MRGECYICKRWGTGLQQTAPGKGRHDDCRPGSTLWRQWYEALPQAERDAMNRRSGNAAKVLYEATAGP